MDIDRQIAEYATDELKAMWGGRLPTWDEYKRALHEGRVRANKTIAAQVINAPPIPRVYFILYNVLTIWIGLLIFPVTTIAWFFAKFSAHWILGAAFLAWFLVKVSREGHCEGMKAGAERNKEFYDALIKNGAFLFGPE